MPFLNQQAELYDQLLVLLENHSFEKLPFFLEFKALWEKSLRENIFEPIVFHTKISDNSQAFEKSAFLQSNYEIKFIFDINHIRSIFDDEKKSGQTLLFSPCNLENQSGNILLLKSRCAYNYFSKSDRRDYYGDTTEIFVSLMPLLPFEYFIVDGNHRISASIDNSERSIPAYLINPEYTPLFLMSSSEIVTFAFLLDLAFLYIFPQVRREGLIIFKYPSILTFLKDKGRLR